jgi:hypothetical protein
MKQVWPNYSYSPTTNVLTLTGLNIDRDQLLLVTAADRGRIMYNFADSSVTASAFTSGANTALTLVATTAGLTTTAALVIYYDDQLASTTVTVSSLPAISGTVTANLNQANFYDALNYYSSEGPGLPVRPDGDFAISGTVTIANPYVNFLSANQNDGNLRENINEGLVAFIAANTLPISGTITIGSALPAGTNRIGVVTIGAGTVTIGAGTAQIGSVTASISGTVPVSGTFFQATQPVSLTTLPALVAGTAQIGSVTASISGTVPISISSVTVGNSVTIGSLPALAAGTAQIGSVTASISGTVPISISSVTIGNSVTIGSLPAISGTVTANIAISSSAITSGSFTSLTSATLVPANTARKMATVYNLGAGQLFVNAGASATTLGGGFMVALSSGDFYECDYTTTTLSAIFATAGTASWVSH